MNRFVYLVGEPGAGKSTLASKTMDHVADCKHPNGFKYRITNCDGLEVAALGEERTPFSGTDTLSMSVSTRIKQSLETGWPETVLFGEGDRLTNNKFFSHAKKHTDLKVVLLSTPRAVSNERRISRAAEHESAPQNVSWVQGRITKLENLHDHITHVIQHATLEEQAKELRDILHGISDS